jgi:hypothetical protein
MSQIKTIDTYTIESPILEIGDFTDSKGRKVSLNEDILSRIYDNIKDSAPGKMRHNDKTIAEIKTYILSNDRKKIIQKSLVTDVDTFKSQQKNGFTFVSPEIELISDNDGNIVNAHLDGYALSCNPGLIHTPYTVNVHHFDAPESTTPNNSTDSWTSAFNAINSKIDNLTANIDKINNIKVNDIKIEEPKIMTPPNTTENMITMSKDDLAALIKSTVSEALANKFTEPAETPITETPEDPKIDNTQVPPELLAKLAKLETEHSNLLKRQRDEKLGELKKLGIEDPKKLISEDISIENQISMLDKYREAFARQTPISTPVSDISSDGGSTGTKKGLNVHDALAAVGIGGNNEVYRKCMEDLTKTQFGIFDPLFDESGNWIDHN